MYPLRMVTGKNALALGRGMEPCVLEFLRCLFSLQRVVTHIAWDKGGTTVSQRHHQPKPLSFIAFNHRTGHDLLP